MAPDEADAGGIVAAGGKQPRIFEGTPHDKAGADLRAGACVATGNAPPAEAEAAEPAERRMPAELLLEVQAEPAFVGRPRLPHERLEAIHARSQSEEIAGA